MIIFESKGDFKKTDKFLRKMLKLDITKVLERYGREGVVALSTATPVETGLAANSWSYDTKTSPGLVEIIWTNSDIENGYPVAVMIQYGHGTGTGGYVRGIDYINPALKPIFDRIAKSVWKEVTSA